jgi:hypothetical protein
LSFLTVALGPLFLPLLAFALLLQQLAMF